MILTSNRGFAEWGDVFGDPVIATALLERLLYHAFVIQIEGAKLSDREIEALLSRIDTASFTSRNEQEVAGYAEVMDELFQSWQTIPLAENDIKQLHGMLLRHSAKDEHHRRHQKTTPNHVEAFGPQGESLGVVF